MPREARARLLERMKAAETDETPRLKTEAQKVRTELANLAEAVASGGAVIPALVGYYLLYLMCTLFHRMVAVADAAAAKRKQ